MDVICGIESLTVVASLVSAGELTGRDIYLQYSRQDSRLFFLKSQILWLAVSISFLVTRKRGSVCLIIMMLIVSPVSLTSSL